LVINVSVEREIFNFKIMIRIEIKISDRFSQVECYCREAFEKIEDEDVEDDEDLEDEGH